jgi:uncharacterized protein DUF4159
MEPWFSAKNLFFPQSRRDFLRTSAIGLSGLTLGPPTSIQAADENPRPLVDRVRRSIERSVQFLRDQENHNGNWEIDGGLAASRHGGETSLVLLALLNAGVKSDDPIIERGLKFLRTIEPRDTYVVGLQTMVFAAAGKQVDFPLIQRNVQWLIDARVMNGKELQGWTYMKGGDPKLPVTGITDNSNTQYALLGLHEGHRAGAEVPKAIWKSIEDYYLKSQFEDGGWGYLPKFNDIRVMPPILTMTVAGLCGLLIAATELNEGRETPNADGTFKECGRYKENPHVIAALNWIGKSFRFDIHEAVYYNIYGIERAGRLTGFRFLGNHDWYREGCLFLVNAQREDGSWVGRGAHDHWPVVSTSFALLFLSKGRTPIMINKLVHGPGNDWNNDRNDARNLIEFASREMFKKQPLAWQIFEAKRGLAKGTKEELLGLTGELLMSPVAYFNGHEAPRFSGREEELIKEYVEQGGFLFAEACCGKTAFRKGFEDLMTKLFPNHELKDLPAGHQIWSAPFPIKPGSFGLQGIEMGCKTVVVFSPQDMSCYWESNRLKDEKTLEAFRLGGNIIAYASGMELPKPRLTPADVVRKDDERKVPRGFLKVAQLKYGDDWKPAPNAMKNLTAYLADRPRLDVAVEKDPVTPASPKLGEFKFFYMHGRRSFDIGDGGLDNLRGALQTGGLLFADACCGKKEFDTSFREFIKKLFPNQKLERIPPEDDLYGKEVNDEVLSSVRCRRERGAPFREVAPELEGVKFKGRWVVIYSRYDVGCALEKHQSTDCVGHDYDSALKIGAAAVLYALKR